MKHFLLNILTIWVLTNSTFAQIQLTDIKSRNKYPNLKFTEIRKNANQASIYVNCLDGDRLFYFTEGKFSDKSKYLKNNYTGIKVLPDNILVNQGDSSQIFTIDSVDKRVSLSKLPNFTSYFGIEKNQKLSIVNDSLFIKQGDKETSLGFKIEYVLHPGSFYQEKYYLISAFISTANSYALESAGKIIYNGVTFPREELKDYSPQGLFFVGDILYHFNKYLSCLTLTDNKLNVKILNDTTQIISKLNDILYFQNKTYYELRNEQLVKSEIYFISQPQTQIQIKRNYYEISLASEAKNNIRNMVLKNLNNGATLNFSDIFLSKKQDNNYYSLSQGPMREFIKVTLLKDSLFRVENVRETHNYFFNFDKTGSLRYFEEIGEDSLKFHLLDEDLNYFSLSKKDYTFKKQFQLPVEKDFFQESLGPGDYIIKKDSIYFPQINYSLAKTSKGTTGSFEIINPYFFSFSNSQKRLSSDNNYYLFDLNNEHAVFFNAKSKTFKEIVFKNYELLKEPYMPMYTSNQQIQFLKNDILILRGNAGYVAFLGDEFRNFPLSEYGFFESNNGVYWFSKEGNYRVFDDLLNPKFTIYDSHPLAISDGWIMNRNTDDDFARQIDFYTTDRNKEFSVLEEGGWTEFLGSYKDIFLLNNYVENKHFFYAYNPEKEETKKVSIKMNTTFFLRKLINNYAYIFDSQNARIVRYNLLTNKLFEMKGVQIGVYLGGGLKAKKGNKLYYLDFGREQIEIVDVTSLDDNALLTDIQKDFFSENNRYYFLGQKDKYLQLFESDENPGSIDEFDWVEIPGVVDTLKEKREIIAYPIPLNGNIKLFSPYKILSFNLISTDGKLIFNHEMNILETNFDAEKILNEFLKNSYISQNLILQLTYANGTKTLRINK